MSAEAGARIVMIEDQVSYGDAFGLALSLTTDMTLVARAADAGSGIELCLELEPDLVVSDYRLPAGATGTAVAQRLRERGFQQPIALLTGFLAPQVQREAAEIPGVAALSKDMPITEIIEALQQLLAVGPPAVTATASDGLSAGELEVLELLNQGLAPTEIVSTLYLSVHTIRAWIKSLHQKLGVTSQPEAISVATRRGLLVPPS